MICSANQLIDFYIWTHFSLMDKKDLKPIFLNTTRKKLVQFEKNFDGKLDLALVNFDVT